MSCEFAELLCTTVIVTRVAMLSLSSALMKTSTVLAVKTLEQYTTKWAHCQSKFYMINMKHKQLKEPGPTEARPECKATARNNLQVQILVFKFHACRAPPLTPTIVDLRLLRVGGLAD